MSRRISRALRRAECIGNPGFGECRVCGAMPRAVIIYAYRGRGRILLCRQCILFALKKTEEEPDVTNEE